MNKKKRLSTEQMNSQNWRYKKQAQPVDDFGSAAGPVKVIKKPKTV